MDQKKKKDPPSWKLTIGFYPIEETRRAFIQLKNK
jgi:hypothetical protein